MLTTLITSRGHSLPSVEKVAHTARKLCVLSHWRVLLGPYSATRILIRMTFPVSMIHHYWAVQWSRFAQVNALCNLLCKKLWEAAASLPSWFLNRRCFTLCITMEVEPRTAEQYKCHHFCHCKNYWGKGMEGGKKVSLHHFLADQKIASSWKKCVLGHPIAWATSYCLLPDTFWLRAPKMPLKLAV